LSPASSDELELHNRLLAGDETASADLFDRYVSQLTGALSRGHSQIAEHDETLILDAVTDALFDYISRPQIYKPNLKSLKNFLYMAARGDLLNKWRKVKDSAHLETSLDERVELGQEFGNRVVEEMSGAQRVFAKIATEELWQQVRAIVPEKEFLQVVALMIEGVRETSAYAEYLGISDLPKAEQRKQVKRVKDRLKKRLQRANWDQWQVTSHGK
jgi:RNA polymerase sigma-70 factor (ECF subfamily)